MQIPKRRGEWRRKIGPADEYLTPEAIEELRGDIARIERARPAAVEELRRTREMGDLSENAAYQEAKARVAGMDSALFRLNERLKFARPITGGTSGAVTVGSTVEVEVGGKRRTLQILGTQETDPGSGRISFHSPVGAALMGKRAGDTATVSTNGKRIEYRVMAVR